MINKTLNKIKYLSCNQHSENYMNLVCINPNCIETSLCCEMCAQKTHINHKVISIKNLLLDYQKQLNLIDPEHKNYLIEKLNINKRQSLKNFFDLTHQLDKMLIGYGESIIDQYNTILMKISLNTQQKIPSDIFQWIKQITFLKEKNQKQQPNHKKPNQGKEKQNAEFEKNFRLNIKKIFQKYPFEKHLKNHQGYFKEMEDFVAKSGQKSIYNDIFNKLKKKTIDLKIEESLPTYEERKNLFIENFNKMNYKIQNLISQTQQNMKSYIKQKYSFSSQFKHQNIQLINPNMIRSINSEQYKVAILQPSLGHINPEYNNTFYIKINNYAEQNLWIGLGICNRDTIISNKYGFSCNKQQQIGHGFYMISANTASWSNSDNTVNCIPKSFPFVRNDVIKVQVLNSQKKIKFSKFKIDLQNSDISKTRVELQRSYLEIKQKNKVKIAQLDLKDVDLTNIILSKKSLIPDQNKAAYELNFEKNNQQKLYACVVLYFIDQEVQLLDINDN